MNIIKDISKIFIAVAMIFQASCKVGEVAPPSPSLTASDTISKLDTVWRVEINDYSITPILNSSKNVLTSKMFNDSRGEVFQLRSGQSGELLWEWSDYFTPEHGFFGSSKMFYKDVLILSNSYKTYAFSSITGQTLWRDNQKGMIGDNSMAIDDEGYVYHTFRDIGNGNRNIYVWRTKYDQLKWEQIYVFSDTVDNGKMANMNIVVSKNTKGENILVFTPVMFRDFSGVNTYASKVIAYNIDERKIEWQVDYNLNNEHLQFWKTDMVAKNDKIYIFAVAGTKYFLQAYQIADGKLAFERSLPDFGVGMYFYKNMVVPLLNGNKPVTAYDLNTGALIWSLDVNNDQRWINFDFEDSKVYKNFLISTQCGNILAINLDNGKEVFFDKPKVMGECLQFGLAINEEKRWFYVQDRKYINCYTLPFQIK